ncbi:VanZ family protein [Aeromicrobium sp. CF3.5]|uniref:VanZ family protein n=1 Tax=Aeromicrobium sp. CF3.5 TaxID=3373078 RepID=UPI003EE44FED
MTRLTRPLLVWAGAYALALVVIALWPNRVDSAFDVNQTLAGQWLLDRGLTNAETYWLVEFWSNVALYAPLGIFAMAMVPTLRWWHTVMLAIVVSGTFELLQGLLSGRTASGQDVVANTMGAAIGAGLVVVSRALRPLFAKETAHG